MGLKQYQKASRLGIIDFDDCLIKDSLIKKLSSLKTFTYNDYYSSNYIIKPGFQRPGR